MVQEAATVLLGTIGVATLKKKTLCIGTDIREIASIYTFFSTKSSYNMSVWSVTMWAVKPDMIVHFYLLGWYNGALRLNVFPCSATL